MYPDFLHRHTAREMNVDIDFLGIRKTEMQHGLAGRRQRAPWTHPLPPLAVFGREGHDGTNSLPVGVASLEFDLEIAVPPRRAEPDIGIAWHLLEGVGVGRVERPVGKYKIRPAVVVQIADGQAPPVFVQALVVGVRDPC